MDIKPVIHVAPAGEVWLQSSTAEHLSVKGNWANTTVGSEYGCPHSVRYVLGSKYDELARELEALKGKSCAK